MKANPFHYLERYVGDHYKIRFGEYRGLADVDFTERVVYSRYLEHRSQIYRKR